jgi:hypothetical protein
MRGRTGWTFDYQRLSIEGQAVRKADHLATRPMRFFISTVLLLVSLLNSGCAIFEKETSNRGGYLDYVLDEYWLKADSKQMRALRAFAIQVSLARIASVSAKNEADRQLLAIRIGALTARFLPIYMCAFNKNPLAVSGAETDPCFYYDSAMVDYSTGLFDLAMIALPIEDGQKLVTMIVGSSVNPINIIDLLNTLLQIGKDALKYGRIVGALYRDTIELEVQLWLTTPPIDGRPAPFQVTIADVTPLYNIYARGNDDMPAWIAEMAALRGRGLEPIPQAKFYYELGGLLSYICDLITSDRNTKTSCKKNLPTPSLVAVSVTGPTLPFRVGDVAVPKGGGTPSPQGPSQKDTSSQQQKLQVQIDALTKKIDQDNAAMQALKNLASPDAANQIATLQKQINDESAKLADLKNQLAAAKGK